MKSRDNLKRGIKKNSDGIERFINNLAKTIANLFETGGTGISDAFRKIGDKTGITPLFLWIGGSIKEIFSLIATLLKATLNIVGGILGGTIKMLGGLVILQGSLILEGLADLNSPVVGGIIMVIGKSVALVQSLILAQDFERPLNDHEEAVFRRVFKDSVDSNLVRIIEGRAGLFGLNARAFTLGNTIYMKTDIIPDELLVHETTHAWQYQQIGVRYSSDALSAQWFIPDAYNWRREIVKRRKTEWLSFNREAQAEFLEDLWKYGELRDSSGRRTSWGHGSFYDADGHQSFPHFSVNSNDYTSIATEAVNRIRYT